MPKERAWTRPEDTLSGVQESLLVRSIEGCYFNVVGLPLYRLSRLLEDIGVPLESNGGRQSEDQAGSFYGGCHDCCVDEGPLGYDAHQGRGSGNVAALVTDIRDISAMARDGDPRRGSSRTLLSEKGLTGVAVGELTGEELRAVFRPVDFAVLLNLVPGAIPDGVQPDSAALLLHGDAPYFRGDHRVSSP